MARAWEAALRSSGLPPDLPGARRHRLAIAAPLSAGWTSEAELVDVYFGASVEPAHLRSRLQAALPAGVDIIEVQAISPVLPLLQSEVLWSDYEVVLPPLVPRAQVEAAISAFLERRDWRAQETRDGRTRVHDIRPGVAALRVEEEDEGGLGLSMRLRTGGQGNLRPEQVLKALDLPKPSHVHRTGLVLGGLTPVQRAWRSAGRFRDR
jgi:radical SAM-linked protein